MNSGVGTTGDRITCWSGWKDVPKEFRVTIAATPAAALLLDSRMGAPPYDIVNLIGWLNDPPEIEGVSGREGLDYFTIDWNPIQFETRT
ncbi:MAG: hypothetical protein R3C05_01930 [Pirellulaceae bacterium]